MGLFVKRDVTARSGDTLLAPNTGAEISACPVPALGKSTRTREKRSQSTGAQTGGRFLTCLHRPLLSD